MKKYIFLLFVFMLSLSSCTSEKSSEHPWEWDDPQEKETLPEQLGWCKISDFGTLPSGVEVYRSPQKINEKLAVAYIVVADLATRQFEVLGDEKGYKKPSDFYAQTLFPIIMNAGYFWDGTSLSLICREGQIVAPNVQTASKDWKTIYYPTRGLFFLDHDGQYKAGWSYTTSEDTYLYNSPSDNSFDKSPLPIPSLDFPKGGRSFDATIAIGGGPVLIRQGEIINSYESELLEISADSSQPRSAIGVTANNEMIFFVSEGRNRTPNVKGFTTLEVAKILKDLGCLEALNLDGGGSSCLLINGKETIKCSDGKQRPIVTAVAIK